MEKLISTLLLVIFVFSPNSEAQSALRNVGDLILRAKIQSRFTFARIETNKTMCSPAVLIGPRTFLTAAHCTPLISSNGLVKIYGPNLAKTVHVDVVSMPVVTDDDFFSDEMCKALIQRLPDEATLSSKQLATCWFKGGAGDLALLIAKQDIQSPMLTLGSETLMPDEILNRLGENAKCGGDLGFFHLVKLKVSEFNKSQVILENKEMELNQSNLTQCGGDSGGIYYRTLQDGSIQVLGIHSASIQKAGPYSLYGKSIFLPLDFFGGTNLLASEAMGWMRLQVAQLGLQICGINISCDGVNLN